MTDVVEDAADVVVADVVEDVVAADVVVADVVEELVDKSAMNLGKFLIPVEHNVEIISGTTPALDSYVMATALVNL